jgi:subtilase family serine protease
VTADASQGGVNTGFYVGLFLSADNVIDGSDVLIGYRYVYDLPRGASSTEDMTITVPSSIGSGTYYLGAVADVWGYLPETNETNNALAGTQITITGADLVMNEVSGPSSALTGDTVVFRNTVASKSGTGGATGFYVGFYLSADQVIDGSDMLIATRYVSGLGASGASTEDTAFVLPSAVPSGDYYIGAIADVYGHVVEQDEANNTALGGSIKVTGPDLTMSSVSGPTSAYTGDSVTFTTAITADAAGGGATGFYVGIYLSADEVIDGSDLMIATRYLPALSAGTTSTEDTTFGMPGVPTGTYYIGALADPYGHVVESNETNNAVLGSKITVTGSDLAVTEASGPTSAYTGDAITVKNTVEASSNGGDASWFYVGIYLSSDDVIDTSDTLLGYRYLYGLARGTSSTDDSVVGIPGSLASGTYYLGVIADPWGYVPENDETNNVRRANAITITASDLTMTSVTGPASAAVGQNITVSNTVAASSSGGSASGFYVGIYLSSDNVIDGNDTLIANRYVYGLNKGDAATEDTVVTVPGLSPGTYYLGAIADVYNYVPESNETNNSMKGTQIELTAQ